MTEFFAMGGYAAYVWPAYAVPLVLMVVLWLVSRRGLKDSETILAGLESQRSDLRKSSDATDAADVVEKATRS